MNNNNTTTNAGLKLINHTSLLERQDNTFVEDLLFFEQKEGQNQDLKQQQQQQVEVLNYVENDDVAVDLEVVDGPCVEQSVHESFEGPEKLLEVWFRSDYPSEGRGKLGLRTVPRKVWDKMLALVKCTVLNVITNDYFDAYLLSESSMFVWNGKLILKTCGTTTLLNAVPRLLEIASGVGLSEVENIFYSRKKFMFPDKQLVPHCSFAQEVEFLDEIFDGSSYVLGSLNDEHWYLYMTEESISALPDHDRTVEILMGQLDPQAMTSFFRGTVNTAEEASKRSGITDLFPDAILDDFLFSPCGYSANGMLGPYYFTIHVTPQEPCSFASFETNIPVDDYQTLFEKVIDIFRPGHLTATLFTGQEALECSQHHKQHPKPLPTISSSLFSATDYVRSERIFYQFDTYNLLFASLNKTYRSQKKKKPS